MNTCARAHQSYNFVKLYLNFASFKLEYFVIFTFMIRYLCINVLHSIITLCILLLSYTISWRNYTQLRICSSKLWQTYFCSLNKLQLLLTYICWTHIDSKHADPFKQNSRLKTFFEITQVLLTSNRSFQKDFSDKTRNSEETIRYNHTSMHINNKSWNKTLFKSEENLKFIYSSTFYHSVILDRISVIVQ